MKPNVVAIVPAAGRGARTQLGPKAFLKIDGVDLVTHAVQTLSPLVNRVLVALPPDCLDQADPLLAQLAEIIPGRSSRHSTVGTLLEECREEFVIILDVSRPFASADLLRRVLEGVRHAGAAATVWEQHNPVARFADGYLIEALPFESVRQVQTPLAIRRSILNEAYQIAAERQLETASTYELVLMTGAPILAIPGEQSNIKITTAFDWQVASSVVWPDLKRSLELGGANNDQVESAVWNKLAKPMSSPIRVRQ